VNIHALMVLKDFGYPIDHPSVKKIFKFLDSQKLEDFWIDKWNASTFYTSAHYVIACAKFNHAAAQSTVNWILKNQRQDGSWGTFGSTAEETAYCLQALSIWSTHVKKVPADVVQRGRKWLLEHYDLPYSPIWIGKGLYSAELVSRSSVLSAMLLTDSF
jgi:prenyltransferase beta subunit